MKHSLHQALWNHEKDALDLGRQDLNGQPVLRSQLEVFNRFVCRVKEGERNSLAPSRLDCRDLTPDLLRNFFKDLYNTTKLKPRELSPGVKLLKSFMEGTWAKLIDASPLLLQENVIALDLNFKEFKRLRSLHQHLLLQLGKQKPVIPPTESLTEDPNQLKLFSTDQPLAEVSDYDIWQVVKKIRGQQSLSLIGSLKDKTRQIPVDRGVYDRVLPGDLLPLGIALTWDERPFIEVVDPPLFGDES